eukprot:9368910-Pyramimonas_sp.AAC.2
MSQWLHGFRVSCDFLATKGKPLGYAYAPRQGDGRPAMGTASQRVPPPCIGCIPAPRLPQTCDASGLRLG